MFTRLPVLLLAALAAPTLSSCEQEQSSGGSGSGTGRDGSHATIVLTEANFQTEVLASTQPVLVDFWASWCAPCRMIAPTVEEIATEYAGRVKVGKVDTDANSKLAIEYRIDAIPALLVYKNGKVVQRLVGLQDKKSIAAALDSALK